MFFVILDFFRKFYQNMGQKLGSNNPHDKREAKKEFHNDIKPAKLKETMIVFPTPIKVSS